MAMPSRTARKLTLAVLLAAVIPLAAAIIIARSLVSNVSAQLYNPRVGEELERSLDLYKELAASLKATMRFQAEAIAAQEGLRAAAMLNHRPSIDQELTEIFPTHANLVQLAVVDADGEIVVEKKRLAPVNETTELALEVRRPLSKKQDGPMLLAVFVTPKARFDERDGVEATVRTYRQIEASRAQVEHAHLYAFTVLLAITMLAAVTLGTLLSRSVTRRIGVLAQATQAVGAGDLTVRVPVQGNDEITGLAKAFNRMLREVQRSRARIEFLQRMGTWQEMARRLAHEIKNPLTPIQLAVEEIHARYKGDDPAFRNLLETTHGVVTEEVGTLRRLVTEFSAFARLPRAELSEHDVCDFLRKQREHMVLFTDDDTGILRTDADLLEKAVDVSWDVPKGPIAVHMDRQMMHRVLVNLVRNAAQAVSVRESGHGRVRVRLREVDKDWLVLEVDDDGTGIPKEMRETIFDPYVTTKADGTGLGLSIVKKIVMEHGGSVEASESEWGGARMVVTLPRSGSAASFAARAQGGQSAQLTGFTMG
jgi:nitrogen fixation/metabolism regulation signal transduction histidine kinase